MAGAIDDDEGAARGLLAALGGESENIDLAVLAIKDAVGGLTDRSSAEEIDRQARHVDAQREHAARERLGEQFVGRLQQAIDSGQLQATGTIDGAALVAAGVLRRTRDGVRLLAKGEIKTKLSLKVAGASKAAVAAVEKAGGSVEVMAPRKAPAEAGAKT